MTDELPESWAIAALSDISAINPRHDKAIANETMVTFVPMAAISEDSPNFLFREERRLGDVRKGFTHFADGDVLFAKITPCMENGKGAVAQNLRNGLGCGTTEVHVIRPVSSVDQLYLYRYLSQGSIRRFAKENFTGTAGQLRVPTEFIKALNIPLPPRAEQRRIVEKLEKLLAEVEQCKERMAKIPVLLKRFRQSVLAAACSGRLTADWREEHLNQLCAEEIVRKLETAHDLAGGYKRGNASPPTEDVHDLNVDDLPSGWSITDLKTAVRPDRPITYGILKPGPDMPDGIPYIRVADFPNDRLIFDNIRRTSKSIDQQYARARLSAGDILLSIRGTVGRVCRVPRELENANITQDTARLTVQDFLDPAFVLWFLRAPQTQKRMQKAVKGVAIRGINIGDVRALQLPVPSLDEQQEIVRRVEALFVLADSIEGRYQGAKKQVDGLTQSILAKAFRGELVPTETELAAREGRTYESAAQLIEKIHRSRKRD